MPSDKSESKSKLVYSTESSVSKKERPLLKSYASVSPAQQKLYVKLDRKARGGKSVTLIEGFQISEKDREALLKQLKTKFGTGGAVKGEVLEIQGDHREGIITFLESAGYKPKRAGG